MSNCLARSERARSPSTKDASLSTGVAGRFGLVGSRKALIRDRPALETPTGSTLPPRPQSREPNPNQRQRCQYEEQQRPPRMAPRQKHDRDHDEHDRQPGGNPRQRLHTHRHRRERTRPRKRNPDTLHHQNTPGTPNGPQTSPTTPHRPAAAPQRPTDAATPLNRPAQSQSRHQEPANSLPAHPASTRHDAAIKHSWQRRTTHEPHNRRERLPPILVRAQLRALPPVRDAPDLLVACGASSSQRAATPRPLPCVCWFQLAASLFLEDG